MGLAGIRIFVLDDEREAVDFLVEELQALGADVVGGTDPVASLELIVAGGFDVVISDVEMPGLRGVDLLDRLKAAVPGTAVILVTAFGSIDLAVDALRRGAIDFVTKPFRVGVLVHALERAVRERALESEVGRLRRGQRDAAGQGIVVRSEAMRRTVELATRAAGTGAPVLLTGESGTGKSRLARFIHEQSGRAAGPFVTINCAAVPGPLLEAELFGVKRGAYTGAHEDRPGMFIEAHRGTLFLDEIGELALDLQPKLLHALESSTVRAVGGRGPTAVDVRLIAATNRDLGEAMRNREFRQDLFFRLNVISIEVPALRDRLEDIPPLVDALLTNLNNSGRSRRVFTGLSRDALKDLTRRTWTGNVRELANVLERGAAMATGELITQADIATGVAWTASGPDDSLRHAAAAGRPLADVEKAYAALVVERCQGSLVEAARVLGIDRRTLQKKLESSSDRPLDH
jgi:DNA-binding NtrC family response regulator